MTAIKRIQRLNSLIQREISQILLKEFDFSLDLLVTITRVEVSVDLIDCGVWVSVFPEAKRKKVMEFLNNKIYFIQQKLNQRLRMRPIPKIRFLEETLTSEAAKVENILEKLKGKGK